MPVPVERVELPGIGVRHDILTDDGVPVEGEEGGLLVVTEPWPSMLRGIWGDPERFKETYWEKFGDKYFAGDGAREAAVVGRLGHLGDEIPDQRLELAALDDHVLQLRG